MPCQSQRRFHTTCCLLISNFYFFFVFPDRSVYKTPASPAPSTYPVWSGLIVWIRKKITAKFTCAIKQCGFVALSLLYISPYVFYRFYATLMNYSAKYIFIRTIYVQYNRNAYIPLYQYPYLARSSKHGH